MTDGSDIAAVGLDLRPETLIQAYRIGIFPWPSEDTPLLWYSPRKRAVLDFERLHVPPRLFRFLRKQPWTFSVDSAFSEVIEACSVRPGQGTWILPEMKAAYRELHRLGHAHSVEVWEGDHLIGGVYGVDIAGYFAGESMFHRKSNASKAALLCAIALQKGADRKWMDVQVMSPHLETLGAHEITRAQFQKRLERLQDPGSRAPTPFGRRERFDYWAFNKSIE